VTTRRARLLLFVGLIGLVSMRVAYDLTYEPAPAVRVEWRKGISDTRRKWLETIYRLGDPQAPHGNSYAYVLFDTRQGNIRSLVTDRYVVGTGDIDRERFAVPWESLQESDRFMWVADRVPVLRYTLIRWLVIGALAATALVGARKTSLI
jgi:hypothetical protein